MASDVSKVRRQQQDEISDLQSDFRRRRKQLLEAQEEELDGLKKGQHVRKQQVVDQGLAAINHIRDSQSKSLESAQETRQKAQEKSAKKLNEIETVYRQRIQDAQASRQTRLTEERDQANRKINEVQDQNEVRMRDVRERADTEYRKTRDEARQEQRRVETASKERVATLRAKSQEEQLREQKRGDTQLERVRTENRENHDRLRAQGTESIKTEQEAQARRRERLNSDSEKQIDRQKTQWQERERNVDQEYSNKIQNKKQAYEDQLKMQSSRFKSVYAHNAEDNERSLQVQRRNAAKEMNELKSEFFREAQHYAGKVDDPFYKVVDRGSRIIERPSEYVLEAYAPEHEKDATKITVEKDKVTIQGQRSFKDKVESDDKKVSTASYQSFREEFPFGGPVITDGLTRERNGDWVTIVIPKLQSYSKKV